MKMYNPENFEPVEVMVVNCPNCGTKRCVSGKSVRTILKGDPVKCPNCDTMIPLNKKTVTEPEPAECLANETTQG